MDLPTEQPINYQLISSFNVLEGKSTSSIPEHYYLFKDENGDIQVKVISDIDNEQPVMAKDLLVMENNYVRLWTRSINTMLNKIMAE
ncbi:hypothetical protein Xbed_03252 [Xenorhabdus beddingii]|uniref:Uncharacterized protein n=2 Tax=Xenorhabdus beddingii TaxID=40578 RepID=A0A1Y2SI94_9GAMM|nr:hypothetical protein Xbed_03252 [Xenorhabdus beddingii]